MLTLASCVLLVLMLLLLLLLLLVVVAESVVGFPRGRSLFKTSRARVGYLVHSFSARMCVTLCHRVPFNIIFGHVYPPHSTHRSPISVSAGSCARTHTNETFSCWCGCRSYNIKRFTCFELYLPSVEGRRSRRNSAGNVVKQYSLRVIGGVWHTF